MPDRNNKWKLRRASNRVSPYRPPCLDLRQLIDDSARQAREIARRRTNSRPTHNYALRSRGPLERSTAHHTRGNEGEYSYRSRESSEQDSHIHSQVDQQDSSLGSRQSYPRDADSHNQVNQQDSSLGSRESSSSVLDSDTQVNQQDSSLGSRESSAPVLDSDTQVDQQESGLLSHESSERDVDSHTQVDQQESGLRSHESSERDVDSHSQVDQQDSGLLSHESSERDLDSCSPVETVVEQPNHTLLSRAESPEQDLDSQTTVDQPELTERDVATSTPDLLHSQNEPSVNIERATIETEKTPCKYNESESMSVNPSGTGGAFIFGNSASVGADRTTSSPAALGGGLSTIPIVCHSAFATFGYTRRYEFGSAGMQMTFGALSSFRQSPEKANANMDNEMEQIDIEVNMETDESLLNDALQLEDLKETQLINDVDNENLELNATESQEMIARIMSFEPNPTEGVLNPNNDHLVPDPTPSYDNMNNYCIDVDSTERLGVNLTENHDMIARRMSLEPNPTESHISPNNDHLVPNPTESNDNADNELNSSESNDNADNESDENQDSENDEPEGDENQDSEDEEAGGDGYHNDNVITIEVRLNTEDIRGYQADSSDET